MEAEVADSAAITEAVVFLRYLNDLPNVRQNDGKGRGFRL